MAATIEVTDATEVQTEVVEGEAAATPQPEVLRVQQPSRFSGPLGLAMVTVPLLVISFLGTLFVARAMAPPPPAAEGHHWSYEGATGPAHWGEIDPHALTCLKGEQQSPIDITPARLMQLDWLTPIALKYNTTKAELVNNGHTFQVNYAKGSRMTFLGREYELLQFHFHTPSEHLVNGRPAEMELHLVHAVPGAAGDLAVLGILIAEGAENPFFAKFWHQLPEKKDTTVKTEIEINAQDVVPRNLSYFSYDGSLTTPPCSEGVRWILLKQAITASPDQIAKVKAAFGNNARPVQGLKDRYVKEEVSPLIPSLIPSR